MPVDAVALDVIWNRLISICGEAETVLMRTAFSPAVREAKDFCCLLLDPKGDSIAQGSASSISFLCAAPLTGRNVVQKFPAESLEPGDIVLTNLSWLGTGHLYDVFVMDPIFYRGQVVALAATVAHWPDIGGRGRYADNRSVYEEGLQLPILKIAKRGQLNEEVLTIIRQNVRWADDVIGDFEAQLAANNLIRSRLIELIERQRIEDFGEIAEAILTRSEAAMRKAIAQIPDGDYENEVHMDGVDRTLTVKAKVSVRGTDIHVDYAGTSPQTEYSINSVYNFTYGISASNWPSSIRNTPVEMVEYCSQVVLIERKQFRSDSGGPGRFRGGCGEELDLRLIGQPAAMFQAGVGTIQYPARGVLGGHGGALGSVNLNGAPITDRPTFPIPMTDGDRISVKTPGSGGFGDPLERDPSRVLEDVVAGLVSPGQAVVAYGVVIDGAGKTLDVEATAALRRSRRLVEADVSGATRN